MPNTRNLNPRGRFIDKGPVTMGGPLMVQSDYISLGGFDIAPVGMEEVAYEENGAGMYTGSVRIPPGAYLLDIYVLSTVLWAAATSALMDIGDATDPDGYFTQINLKATDLLVNEVINFNNLGGKQGAYIVAATGQKTGLYSASERIISGVVTSVGAGTAGRTRMGVMFAMPHSYGLAVKS